MDTQLHRSAPPWSRSTHCVAEVLHFVVWAEEAHSEQLVMHEPAIAATEWKVHADVMGLLEVSFISNADVNPQLQRAQDMCGHVMCPQHQVRPAVPLWSGCRDDLLISDGLTEKSKGRKKKSLIFLDTVRIFSDRAPSGGLCRLQDWGIWWHDQKYKDTKIILCSAGMWAPVHWFNWGWQTFKHDCTVGSKSLRSWRKSSSSSFFFYFKQEKTECCKTSNICKKKQRN